MRNELLIVLFMLPKKTWSSDKRSWLQSKRVNPSSFPCFSLEYSMHSCWKKLKISQLKVLRFQCLQQEVNFTLSVLHEAIWDLNKHSLEQKQFKKVAFTSSSFSKPCRSHHHQVLCKSVATSDCDKRALIGAQLRNQRSLFPIKPPGLLQVRFSSQKLEMNNLFFDCLRRRQHFLGH